MLSDNFRQIIIGKMEHPPAGNPLVTEPLTGAPAPGSPETEAPAKAATTAPAGRPRTRGLAHGLVEDFGRKIRDQALRPGDRLPTEAEIVHAYGVSRTVVREAISRLQ